MIRTEFIHPPVPARIYDWMAWVEGEVVETLAEQLDRVLLEDST